MQFKSLVATALLAAGVLAETGKLGDACVITDNPRGKIYVAHFDGEPIQGTIYFAATEYGKGVDVEVSISSLKGYYPGPYGYHIHDQPVAANGDCASTKAHLDPYQRGQKPPCDKEHPETCEVGDLSGKHGKIEAIPYKTQYVELYASTKEGIGAFLGNRSIVIHANDEAKTRIACTNIVPVVHQEHKDDEDCESTTAPSYPAATPSPYPEQPSYPSSPEQPAHPGKPEKPCYGYGCEHEKKPEHPKAPEYPTSPEYPTKPEKPCYGYGCEHEKKPEHPKAPEYPTSPEYPTKPEHPEHPSSTPCTKSAVPSGYPVKPEYPSSTPCTKSAVPSGYPVKPEYPGKPSGYPSPSGYPAEPSGYPSPSEYPVKPEHPEYPGKPEHPEYPGQPGYPGKPSEYPSPVVPTPACYGAQCPSTTVYPTGGAYPPSKNETSPKVPVYTKPATTESPVQYTGSAATFGVSSFVAAVAAIAALVVVV